MFKRLALTFWLLFAVAAVVPAAHVRAADSNEVKQQVDAGAKSGSEVAEPAQPPLFPGSTEDVKTLLPTAIWVLIIFTILVVVLYLTAWKNVLGGLESREARIRKAIADAETSRTEAQAALAGYNKQIADAEQRVRDIIARGTADAERLATSIRMTAQQESEATKERATREIEQAKNDALRQVYDRTAELATSVAEKIIRRNLNADDQRELVNQSLEQLGAVAGRS